MRRSSQDVDEGLLRVLPPVEGPQQNSPLDFEADRIGPDRLTRQQILKLTEPSTSCASRGAQPP